MKAKVQPRTVLSVSALVLSFGFNSCSSKEGPPVEAWIPSPDGTRMALVLHSTPSFGPPDNSYLVFVEPATAGTVTSKPVWIGNEERPNAVFWLDNQHLQIVVAGGSLQRGHKPISRPREDIAVETRRWTKLGKIGLCDDSTLIALD